MLAMLDAEARAAAARLERCQSELGDMAADKLKDKGRRMREAFIKHMSTLVRGTVAPSPE